MPTNPNRPVLISVAHYLDELEAGTLSVFDVIDTTQRLGADGVELRRETWPKLAEELPAARAAIEQAELLVTFATHATLFNDDDEGDRQLRADINTAKALGSPQLRVFQGPAPDDDDEAGWQLGRDAVAYAAGQGVVIALENYARTPGGTLAEIKRVLDRLPSPALKTNIDIGNYFGRDEDVVKAIHTVGDRAVSAHLKDVDPNDPDDRLTYLGGGQLPLAAIMDALDALPQRLIYCFEFRGGGDPEGRISKSLAYLRERSTA